MLCSGVLQIYLPMRDFLYKSSIYNSSCVNSFELTLCKGRRRERKLLPCSPYTERAVNSYHLLSPYTERVVNTLLNPTLGRLL